MIDAAMGKSIRMLSHFNMNRLLKHRWIVKLLYGYIDFFPNLCYIDQITCSAAHGKLIRHKTLADGDGECNFWILGDKEPEAVADVGSK